MKTATALLVAAALAGCATTRSQMMQADARPASWPGGVYNVTGRVSFTADGTALSDRNRTYTATLIVDPGNQLSLIDSNAGTCGGAARAETAYLSFGCGDVTFSFSTDDETITGSVTASVTYQVRTGEERCIQYQTDPQGNRTCVRWDRDVMRDRRATATGQLHVTRAG